MRSFYFPKQLIIRAGILAFAFTAISFFAYHLSFLNRVIPNVYLDGKRISGISTVKLQPDLGYLDTYDPVISFRDEPSKQDFVVKASDIGLYYNSQETIKKALLLGRTGNFIQDNLTKFNLLFKGYNLTPEYLVNQDLLDLKISQIQTKVESPFYNAYFYISNNKLEIEKEVSGLRLNKNKLKARILEKYLSFNFVNEPLPMEQFTPEVTTENLTPVKEFVQNIVFNPPALFFEKKVYKLTPENILKSVFLKMESGANKATVTVNTETLSPIIATIAEEINTPPKGEIFLMENGKVSSFRPASNGVVIDEEKLYKDLASAILVDDPKAKTVTIPVRETKVLANNEYGIKELLGEGISKFEGSISGRVFNIALASSNLNGTLIPPGETFSFNKSVGEIDATHGFTSAYIISKGRTVLGEGGGVCQVSTTLFRAVLNSGLPVVTRAAHAYRVSYYEQDAPVGLDATIYQPTVDFKFKNDTAGYILLTASVDQKNLTMNFKIYGTSDGRTIEITKPIITSQTPPPPAVYEETDTLLVGQTKQVDWSAWGASVKFSRKVVKNEKIIIDEEYISNYRPWRAVYLVGTKEP
ncbi:MAG: VanW family protein [Patescibacteria group bacterium]